MWTHWSIDLAQETRLQLLLQPMSTRQYHLIFMQGYITINMFVWCYFLTPQNFVEQGNLAGRELKMDEYHQMIIMAQLVLTLKRCCRYLCNICDWQEKKRGIFVQWSVLQIVITRPACIARMHLFEQWSCVWGNEYNHAPARHGFASTSKGFNTGQEFLHSINYTRWNIEWRYVDDIIVLELYFGLAGEIAKWQNKMWQERWTKESVHVWQHAYGC